MAGIKIFDLPALGRDLAATDLLELSLAGGTGSRKITGQEIMNTSKLNIGTTAIASGVVGRVLFEGAGNVVQESANLFWDNVANRLIIGGSTASNVRANTNEFNIQRDGLVPTGGGMLMFNLIGNGQGMTITNQNGTTYRIGQFAVANVLTIGVSGNNTLNLFTSGNIGINTTTDAGFRLDVNGTARVNGQLEVNSVNSTQGILLKHFALATTATQIYYNSPDAVTYFDTLFNYNASSVLGSYNFRTKNSSNTLTSRLFIQGWDGSIGIGTTIPAATLDVNGTARVATSLAITTGKTFSAYSSGGPTPNDCLKLELTSGGAVLGVQNSNASGFSGVEYLNNTGAARVFTGFNNTNGQEFRFNNFATGGYIDFIIGSTSATPAFRVANTRNILINTTTDAGFRLDVNGTARVSGSDNENVFTVSWGGSNSVSLGSNTANSPTLRLGSIRITAHPGGANLIFSNGFLTTDNNGSNTNRPMILAPSVTGTSTGNVVLLSSGSRTNAYRHNPTSGVLNMVMVGGAAANQYMDFSPQSGNAEFNQLNILNQINTTGTYAGIVRGIYYNPILTSMTGVTHFAFHSTSGRIRFENLPTSPTGLNAGDLYNNLGVLMIV